MTVALLLPAPALYFVAALARRRDVPRRVKARMIAWSLGPAMLLAGPWYLENAGDTVRFSIHAAQYNLLAEGKIRLHADRRPPGLPGRRSGRLALDGGPAGRRGGGGARSPSTTRGRGGETSPGASAATELSRITLLGVAGGAAVLMTTPHFDPRFLLPAWPALAVCGSGWLGRAIAPAPRVLGGLAVALLVIGVGISATRLLLEPRTATSWDAAAMIDELVARHGVRRIGQVGDSPGWNVCKTGLVNELRHSPADCESRTTSRGAPPRSWPASPPGSTP